MLLAALTSTSSNSDCWDFERNNILLKCGSHAAENIIGESISSAFNSNYKFNCSVNFHLVADKTVLSFLSGFAMSCIANNKGWHHDNVEYLSPDDVVVTSLQHTQGAFSIGYWCSLRSYDSISSSVMVFYKYKCIGCFSCTSLCIIKRP